MIESETNKQNNIALSFDIEDWYHGAAITGSSFSLYKDLNAFLADGDADKNDCITEETIRILEILDELDIRATFFVVADVAIRYKRIAQALKKSPHEIASHSLTHQSAIDSKTKSEIQPREKWFEEQKEAKRILEDIFEREVIGFRAPNAYFANWMVPMLVELGFKYDSSIAYNIFYNKTNVTLRNVPSKPYRINSVTLNNVNPDSELLEMPWSNFKLTRRLILPGGGAFFFRLFGYNYFKYVLRRSLKEGDTMFYLHPFDITYKTIPMTNDSNRPLLWINKGKKTEYNLIRLLKKYSELFKPCNEIYNKYVDNY
jgi:peptidoglycan-N-acetylglucosamine deacetylase